MKNTAIFIGIASFLLLPVGRLVAQAPQAEVTIDVKAAQNAKALDQANQQIKQAIQALQAMKTANQQFIEKQEKTLLQLDAMQKDSDQIRILGKRN